MSAGGGFAQGLGLLVQGAGGGLQLGQGALQLAFGGGGPGLLRRETGFGGAADLNWVAAAGRLKAKAGPGDPQERRV